MITASQEPSRESLSYEIEKALHFSNAGGVYLARDPRTDRKVVLKEARPHAGLDGDLRDAVARLHNEAEVLKALSGLDFVPDFHETFTVWEHHYLAEEFIEGTTLWSYMAENNPLTSGIPDPLAADEYAAKAMDICKQLEDALALLHERGYVFADLHPRNIVVRRDGRVALIDFEAAYRPDSEKPPTLGAPGY
jgi:serine/threonine protein kinase